MEDEENTKFVVNRLKAVKRSFRLVLRAIKSLEESGLHIPSGMWKALESAHQGCIGWESDYQYILARRAAKSDP